MTPALKEKLDGLRNVIEGGIDTMLPRANTRPALLHSAMRYSMEAGGKRIRPALVFLASELGESEGDPLAAAVAVECLHTYTLIHDDLPSIDDSDLRRGRPSCHKEFDEAAALLAGDALLTYSFQLLSDHYIATPKLAISLVQDLASASGSERLIGGQMVDIESEGKEINKDTLSFIHENKTAALLTAALTMGLRFTGPTSDELGNMRSAGYHIGMNFQIIDDILDATSSESMLGKPVGSDQAAGKNTYVDHYGIDDAKKHAVEHTEAAIEAITKLGGQNTLLIDFVQDLGSRVY